MLIKQLSGKKILYAYSTSHLKGSNKVRFFYALKGRDRNPGVLERTKSLFLAKGVLLVKPAQEQAIDNFFSAWSCNFEKHYLSRPGDFELNNLSDLEDARLVDGRHICVVREKTDSVKLALQIILGSNIKLITPRELFRNQSLLESFSKEQSLLFQAPTTHALFLYSASHLPDTDKVKFFYALKGRDDAPGALDHTSSKFLAKTVILTPIAKAEIMQEFLARQGCHVTKWEVSKLNNE